MAERIVPGDSDLLLVIDLQNDFCPGGNLPVPRGDEVVPLINRLGQQFPHIVLTQDWHPPGHLSFAASHPGYQPFAAVLVAYGPQVLWPDHCIQGTRGAEFHPGLAVPHAELIVRKGFRRTIDSYSAFFENDRCTTTGLAGYLRDRGFTRLFLAGLALDFCARFSAEDATARGFDLALILDACPAIDVNGSLAATRRSLAGWVWH
jgi:nicotinamidase/pyrazinamidase